MGMDIQAGATHKKKGKGRGRPDMNVTPLVDVVLVLLIIFMVVTPLMHQQFWLHVPPRPDASAEPPPPSDGAETIVVTVNARGQIQINRDIYPDDVFPARLRRMLIASGYRKIYFDAHDDAPFERAVTAMDLARGAGAAHIAVMTEGLQ